MYSVYPSFGEPFCGPGGLSLGLHNAGFRSRWGIDTDLASCQTFEKNLGAPGIRSRVENVNYTELPPVQGLAFGFPCNDFSSVGETLGEAGPFGPLWREAMRAIADVSPTWFVAENVPDLVENGKFAQLSREIAQGFADAGPGYNVAVHVFDFSQYGVAQRRRRVAFVGIREGLQRVFRPPVPTMIRPLTAREALHGAERVPHNNERTRHRRKTIERLSYIGPGQNVWDVEDDLPLDLRINTQTKISSIYKRLDPEKPSYTVTGSGGGGTHMYHWAEPRALTNRERARLQSFPDHFIFTGGKEDVRRQIGMAVPPAGAEQIGRALRNTLEGIAYDSLSPSGGVWSPSE